VLECHGSVRWRPALWGSRVGERGARGVHPAAQGAPGGAVGGGGGGQEGEEREEEVKGGKDREGQWERDGGRRKGLGEGWRGRAVDFRPRSLPTEGAPALRLALPVPATLASSFYPEGVTPMPSSYCSCPRPLPRRKTRGHCTPVPLPLALQAPAPLLPCVPLPVCASAPVYPAPMLPRVPLSCVVPSSRVVSHEPLVYSVPCLTPFFLGFRV